MLFQGSVFALLLTSVLADIYLHNPRGSNNRLHESGRERANANRLFDSQNNARGGYNVGGLVYFAGSSLPLEWTVQHSCGDQNNHCDIVLQYACHPGVRDGVSTGTIPVDVASCQGGDCDSDVEFGMHEDRQHYIRCQRRQRNKRLFAGDSRLRGDSALYTRQNPAGQRYGYECPEERDHYPYWASSPWRDIALLTNRVGRCAAFKSSSANVAARHECWLPTQLLEDNPDVLLPLSKAACESVQVQGVNATWRAVPAWNLPAPECRQVETTRDNHLGNTRMFEAVQFNWTVPDDAAGSTCVLRVRYNVTTSDYDDESATVETLVTPPSGVPNLNATRGFEFKNNPTVKVFANAPNFGLQLQLNTAQFGRVFQDRSHAFAVAPRPAGVDATDRIVNVNVKGKRGNIVQVYPSVEYDFIPRLAIVSPGDFLHLHWTGSNTNNAGNDGQGLAGTDRSNIVPLLGNDLAANLVDANATVGFLSNADLFTLATLSPPQFGGSLEWLNDAGTSFNLGLRKVTGVGSLAFASTRNNDFSNRSHKGRVVSLRQRPDSAVVDSQGAELVLLHGRVTVTVPAGAVSQVTYLQVELRNDSWPGVTPHGDVWFTNFLHFFADGVDSSVGFARDVTVKMPTVLNAVEGRDLSVYSYEEASPLALGHRAVDSATQEFVAFKVSRPGVFGVRGFASVTFSVVGLLVALLLLTVLAVCVVAAVVTHRRDPQFFPGILRRCGRSARSDI